MNIDRPDSRRSEAVARILDERIITVLRCATMQQCMEAADSVSQAGLSVLEVTLTTPGALDALRELSRRGGLLVGVGSVFTEAELHAAAEAGARFYASPVLDSGLVTAARKLQLAALPGAFTPTEIRAAHVAGADLVKLFPMPTDGVAWLRAIAAPMPDILLAPSGGVTAESAPALLRAGAAALNVGGWLIGGVDAPLAAEQIVQRASALRNAISAR